MGVALCSQSSLQEGTREAGRALMERPENRNEKKTCKRTWCPGGEWRGPGRRAGGQAGRNAQLLMWSHCNRGTWIGNSHGSEEPEQKVEAQEGTAWRDEISQEFLLLLLNGKDLQGGRMISASSTCGHLPGCSRGACPAAWGLWLLGSFQSPLDHGPQVQTQSTS